MSAINFRFNPFRVLKFFIARMKSRLSSIDGLFDFIRRYS